MAGIVGEISSITLPNGSAYGLKDSTSRLSCAELSAVISSMQEELSGKSSVFIKDPGAPGYEDGKQSDLSIVKLTPGEYAQLVALSATESNTLYIMSSEYEDMFGMQIKNLSAGTDLSDAITLEQLSNAVSSRLEATDISAQYVNQHIHLSAKGQIVGDIDCGDFIKDGMLSTVELCSGQLIFTFNTDAGHSDISVALSNFINETDYYKKSETSSASELGEAFSNCLLEVPSTYKTYDSTLSSLSDDGYALVSQLSVKADISALDKKITIDDHILGVCQQVDLSIIKLSTDEYEQIAGTSSILSNALYIVEGSFEDAYGRQIKNVAPGTDLSDAVNLEQLSSAVSGIQIPTDLSAFTNSPGYLSSVDTTLSIAGAAADAKAVGDALSVKADISSLDFSKVVLSAGLLSSKLDELVVNNVTKAQYDVMLSAGTLCSDQLYSIDSLQLDARDDWVINVKTPELSSDAANKAYVDQQLSNAGGGYAFDIYKPPYDSINNMYVLKPGKFNVLSSRVTDGCVLVLEEYTENQIYKVKLSSDAENIAHISLLADENSATETPGAYAVTKLNSKIDWLAPNQTYVFEVSYGNVTVNDDYNGDALVVVKPYCIVEDPVDSYGPGLSTWHILPVDNACNYLSTVLNDTVYNLHMPPQQNVNGIRRMRQFKLAVSSHGLGEVGSQLSILGTDIAGSSVTFRYKSDRSHICAPLSGEVLTFVENKKGTFDVNFEDEVNLDEINSAISTVNSALSTISGDFDVLSNQLSSKQDKLADAQLSDINYIPHLKPENTIVVFTDGTVSSFNVSHIDSNTVQSWEKDPKSIKIGTNCTLININGFKDKTSLTSVTFAKERTTTLEIAAGAFSGTNIKNITIPEFINFITDQYNQYLQFGRCQNLTDVIYECSSLSGAVFYQCTNLTSIAFTDNLKYMGNKVFNPTEYQNSSLKYVSIPNSVTAFGQTFYQCRSLTAVDLPEKIHVMPTKMFYNCSSLTGIAIPPEVSSIHDMAFGNCSSLTSIDIPDSVKKIGIDTTSPSNAGKTFGNCVNLSNVTIGAGVTDIISNAFYNCTNLTSIVFRNRLSSEIPSGAPWGATNATITTWNDASQEWVDEKLSSIDIPNDLSSFTNSPGYLLASQLSALQSISNPKYSVNSICDTLISVLNILKELQ